MLFSLKRQQIPAPRVQKALRVFVKNCIAQNDEFSELLFPAWFQPVVTAGSKTEGLWPKSKIVFDGIRGLSAQKRREFLATFDNHNAIEELCSDTGFRLLSLSSFPTELIESFGALTEHLFDDTMSNGKTCATALGLTEPCFPWYFKKFRDKYKVCAFCGLLDYPAIGKERAQYDHYLDRKTYPLSAANGANLVPICERCNGSGNKGRKDVIRKNNVRRRAYYPYSSCGGVQVAAECLGIERIERRATWRVSISPCLPVAERQQVDTWIDVFRVQVRYEEVLSNDAWGWLQTELSQCLDSTPAIAISALRRHLRARAEKFEKGIIKTEKAIVMQAMLNHMAEVKGAFLRGFLNNVSATDYGRMIARRRHVLDI